MTVSYRDYLPSVLVEVEGDALERLLFAFQDVLDGEKWARDGWSDKKDENPGLARPLSGLNTTRGIGLDEVIGAIARYIAPSDAPEDFLPWLAGWVAVSLRNDWGATVRRNFIARCVRLYRLRGTLQGIQGVLELSGELGVTVVDFHDDENPPGDSTLNRFKLSKKSLAPPGFTEIPPGFFGVMIAGQYKYGQYQRIKNIVDREKPAHTFYGVVWQTPRMRILSGKNSKPRSVGIRLGTSTSILGTGAGEKIATNPQPQGNSAQYLLLSGSLNPASGVNLGSRLKLGGSVTIEMWLRFDQAAGPTMLVWCNLLSISIFKHLEHYSIAVSSGAGTLWCESLDNVDPPMKVGEWVHIAVVYDKATVKIFLNGACSVSAAATPAENAPIRDGFLGRNSGGTLNLSGGLCEFRVWQSARSEAEIQEYRDVRLFEQYSDVSTAQYYLHAYCPMVEFLPNNGATVVNDMISGPGCLVAGGTITNESGPAIARKTIKASTPQGGLAKYLWLSGSADNISNVPIANWLDLDVPVTIEMWFRCDRMTGSPTLVWSNLLSIRIEENIDGLSFCLAVSGGAGEHLCRSLGHDDPAIAAGTWMHVAVVCDNVTTRLYLNGELSVSGTGPSMWDLHESTLGYLGRDNHPENGASMDSLFMGGICEFRLWQTSRSKAEIQALRDVRLFEQSSDVVKTYPGLIKYCPMVELVGGQNLKETVSGENQLVIDGTIKPDGPKIAKK